MKIPFGFKKREHFNALERILRIGGNLRLDKIKEIIEAYEIYEGNANKASEKIDCSIPTIRKYWRIAEFNERVKVKYEKYESLVNLGYNQTQIASKLKVKPSAVNLYLSRHPELRAIYKKKKEERRKK